MDISSITVKENTHVHFVNLLVQIIKKISHTEKIIPFISLKNPLPVLFFQPGPGGFQGDAFPGTEIQKLAPFPAGAGLRPGLDRAFLYRA